jgi:hypothetical protein
VIGYAVAYAIVKGAGGVTTGLIVASFALTMLAVFIGDIVALSILAQSFGATPVDVLLAYPSIVAEFPGDTLPSYFFGLLGAAFSAYGLYQQRRRARHSTPYSTPYPGFAPGFAPIEVATGPATGGGLTGPQVRVSERGAVEVTLEVAFPPKPTIVRAFYTTMTGRAEVHLDGQLAAKTRVWGMKKEVPLRLGDTGQSLVVRFVGAVSPRIEMVLDGRLVAKA